MKQITSLLCAAAFLVMMYSCNKDDKRDYLLGGTPPVLAVTTNTATDTVSLIYTDSAKQALKISWTNPEYQFTTGVSSQDVSYLLQIDTAGANFTNPLKKVIAISKDLSITLTESQLNDYMLNQLVLAASMQHTLEARVIASLAGNATQITSNVVQLKATPYTIPPKVTPPASGKLFITGSATPGNWQCGCGEPDLTSQEFTQVSSTEYELTVKLTGGGSYLLIPHYGTWNAIAPDPSKYGGLGANNANNVDGDDFKPGGGDLLAPAATGTYKIVVDFQRGKFTVTPQ